MDKIIIEAGDVEVEFPTITEIVEISSDQGIIEIHSGPEVKPEIVAFAIGPRGERGLAGKDGKDGVVTDELAQARDEAIEAANNAASSRNGAEAAEENALVSKNAAAASAANAKTSETNAKASETGANSSKVAAATSATNAKTSETNAAEAETATIDARDAARSAKTAAEGASATATTAATNAGDSASDAADSASAAAGSATTATTKADEASDSAVEALASKNAAKVSETNAKTSETNAKASETNAGSANTDAQNARTDTIAAKTASETARDQARTAQTGSETAKGLAERARDAAQTAEDGAEQALADTVVHRDAAETFAADARASAEQAAKFDPSSYPMKQNNGSDFADPSAVLANIGGQAQLVVPDQAEAEAGTSTEIRGWTAERIRQAIEALAAAAVHRHDVSDIDGLQAVLDGLFVNAVFTGTTSVPTAAAGDRSSAIANTEYVRTALDEIIDAAPGTMDTLNEIAQALGDDPNFAATITQQLAGKADKIHTHVMSEITGLTDALGLLASLTSPAFTGTPTAPTQLASDSSDALATTKHVKDALAASGLASEDHKHVAADITDLQELLDQRSPVGHKHVAADITDLAGLLDAKAPKANPTFTGTVTVPTPAVNDNSTSAASTAYVVTALANGLAGKSDTGHGHVIADIDELQAALDALAPLESPALKGNPTAPTQAAGNSSTRLATTAFVQTAVDPKANASDLAAIATSGLASDLSGYVKVASVPHIAGPDENGTTRLSSLLNGSSASGGSDIGVTATSFFYNVNGANKLLFDADGRMTLGEVPTARLSGILSNSQISGSYDGINYLTAKRLRLTSINDASETSTAHGLQIGPSTGTNIVMDNNELLALNNGALSGFYLNASTFGVSANLTVSGSTDATGALTSRTANTYRIIYGDYGTFMRMDGSNFYILATASGDQTGSYNGLRPFAFNLSTGKVTIGEDLAVSGTIVASSNITAYSDERLKKNVRTIDAALDMVKQMRGVRFDMKDGKGRYYKSLGVIAQEFQKVAPELVIESEETGLLAVNYANSVGILIEAIKELAEQVDGLREAA